MEELPPPVIREHEKVLVVRDDLIPYGSKARFLAPYFASIKSGTVVYGSSPRWGFAQISIAYVARQLDMRAVLFLAQGELTAYTRRAMTLGAIIKQVPMGFLSVCESRARKYAEENGTHLLPCGLSHPLVVKEVARIAAKLKVQPDEVWTVAGSGTLSRGLQLAFPDADFFAVQTGRKLSQADVGQAKIIKCGQAFNQHAKKPPPFPSVPEYDAKVWGHIPKDGKKIRLCWNVGA